MLRSALRLLALSALCEVRAHLRILLRSNKSDCLSVRTDYVEGGGVGGSQATQGEAADEAGTAVEVIELANGETIW